MVYRCCKSTGQKKRSGLSGVCSLLRRRARPWQTRSRIPCEISLPTNVSKRLKPRHSKRKRRKRRQAFSRICFHQMIRSRNALPGNSSTRAYPILTTYRKRTAMQVKQSLEWSALWQRQSQNEGSVSYGVEQALQDGKKYYRAWAYTGEETDQRLESPVFEACDAAYIN